MYNLAKKWRTRAAQFKMNYSNSYKDNSCPSCLAEPDTQALSLECSVIKRMTDVKGDYLDIFQEDVPSDISNTLLNILSI